MRLLLRCSSRYGQSIWVTHLGKESVQYVCMRKEVRVAQCCDQILAMILWEGGAAWDRGEVSGSAQQKGAGEVVMKSGR